MTITHDLHIVAINHVHLGGILDHAHFHWTSAQIANWPQMTMGNQEILVDFLTRHNKFGLVLHIQAHRLVKFAKVIQCHFNLSLVSIVRGCKRAETPIITTKLWTDQKWNMFVSRSNNFENFWTNFNKCLFFPQQI